MRCLGLHTALAPVDSARYNSQYAPSGCLEGTRMSVLARLHEWARSPPAFSVFWLSGTAGTGKTTIAKTFCEEIARAGCMVASFFISRQDEARRKPENIVRSLAYDLATHDWSRAQAIWNELNSTPHLLSLTVPEQVMRILSKPYGLEHIDDDFPIIIIIDALDESTENDNDHDRGSHLIPLLVSALKHQNVKIFVASRNEQYISNYMARMEHGTLKLHHMEKSEASKDVRSFFKTKFRQLVQSRNLRYDWPSSSDLDALIERTRHLFVYAATVMAFVSDVHEDPEQQLQSILDYKNESMEEDDGVFDQLDKLYTQIILAVVMRKGALNARRRDRVRTFIGMVIILQSPLPFPSIVDLMMTHDKKYSKQALRTDLEALSSVIPEPQTDVDPVQIYHPSFPDFIQNPNRCRDHGLHVSSSEASQSAAIACLRLMNKGLHKDICEIRELIILNKDIYDLQQRLDRFVPQSLRYACVHWMSHIVCTGSDSSTLLEELGHFCKSHISHWIEVLSLLGSLSAASHGLLHTLHSCRVSPFQFHITYVVQTFTV
jgi:hypothetical protein